MSFKHPYEEGDMPAEVQVVLWAGIIFFAVLLFNTMVQTKTISTFPTRCH